MAAASLKWFIDSVIYHGASYTHYPKAVSFVDGGGISSTNLLSIERKRLMAEIFPKNMSDEDREVFIKLYFIRSQKWTYFLFKALGVMAWEIDKFKQKYFSKKKSVMSYSR